jgi:adenylylsulfate kinase
MIVIFHEVRDYPPHATQIDMSRPRVPGGAFVAFRSAKVPGLPARKNPARQAGTTSLEEDFMSQDQVQVHWHEHAVSREEREKLNGHAGCVLWFTGLSACGKSTIANLVDHKLHSRGIRSFVLDGDNIRHGLNAGPGMLKERHGEDFAKRFGLGFSAQDREENIRRIGAVAQLFCEAGVVAATAFISPYRVDRDRVRTALPNGDFIEIFVDAPIEVCEARDPKGLYKKARAGELKGFTGIDDPYEAPLKPELVLNAATKSAETLADEVLAYLKSVGKIS